MSKIVTSFYSTEELKELGLKACGSNVLLSRKCSIYSPEDVAIGNNVRIDDFCILSGKITLGNYARLGAYCALYGSGGIWLEDYATLSVRCTVFSATDDYSGDWLVGPMIPDKFTNVMRAPVILHKFVNIGAGSVIMPGVEIQEGAAVGAMSFVRKSLEGWKIYACLHPLKPLRERNHRLQKLATELELESKSKEELENE